jgi:EAL domain-containing protein (putative c-di-GMP-specific phosphodiesterase class I)
MHYQPIFAADGRSLLGYEALMRWPHPGRGMVPPNEFIPLAEASGLIEALGLFALERACAEAARWPGALTVSVNLSAAQFQGRHDLAALVQHCLQTSGLAPERLVLEITESLLMSDAESVVRTLNALALMHVHIAMDDFGTGYSSLGSLWRFPFDKVKIDRAFVKDLEHDDRVALVVRSIVALSHSLGMRVTAEGVETPAQAATLRRLGCDELQGFLLGRPAPSPSLRHEGAVHLPVEAPEPPDFDTLRTQPAPL